MFELVRKRRDRIAMICALVVPPAVCASLVPSRATLPNTDAALLLVAFVVAVAALGNRFAGYIAALGAALWFDFFLTVPYELLSITHRDDIETTVLLLLVGVAVTELAVAARRRARVVAADEALLAVVSSTAGLVARGCPSSAVTDQVRVQLRSLLGARACSFEPSPGRLRGLRLEPDGSLHWADAVWNLAENGFPDEQFDILARYDGAMYGRFAVTPVPATAPSVQARRTAVVLADLAGAAVAAEHLRQST